ncbi:site-specific DNA-methyltransferase [Candidatus Roizmanbacteria bacterium]|nr:site-specific DNA-methyltransferase [Candidatus Roizmanbacteria bacterium]
MPTPITCLGKTFTTEDERRSYFLDEMRKQLPELRKIEGFPIGTDDDILNLSDPPYYTACPNPWLNNFITQWEEEKKVLEQDNMRKADFEVHEPYASDVSEGKNNPIYNAHSYHTKVPHPAIMRYILHYTQPGDIVFDGFAGTGMTGVAAQLCGSPDAELKYKIEREFNAQGITAPVWGTRKSICGDLSPVASFIAYNYNTPVNIEEFEGEAKRILSEVENECGWMYETVHKDDQIGEINYTVWSDIFICPDCGGEIVFWDAAVDKENGEVNKEFDCTHCQARQTKRSVGKCFETVYDYALNTTISRTKTIPVEINYSFNGKHFNKVPDARDIAIIQKIDQTNIPYWYPIDQITKGDKTGEPIRIGITHAHHFYTKRNLWILSAIKNRCKTSQNILLFNSQLINISKLNRYRPGVSFPYNPLSGTLYVGSQISESNIFVAYRNKISKLTAAFNLIKGKSVITTNSATTNKIDGSNTVDYIFTDPPFGANLMYSELNFIWESWLKIKTNNLIEAIENKSQGKNFFDYQDIMLRCFKDYFRILKPGRWMTVEFSNTSAAVWNGIQAALQRAGFVIANVAALDKQQGSFNAVTNSVSVKQDLVISCYKPSSEFNLKFRTESGEVNVWSFVEEHLKHLHVSIIKEQKTSAII